MSTGLPAELNPTETEARLPKPDPALEAWSRRINQSYGRTVASIVETGRRLTQAKADLGHGRWGLLFDRRRLRFGQRRAEMLMEIARCPMLANPKHFSNLPPCWSVLYALTKLPQEALTKAIVNGVIHPELSVKQARCLAEVNQIKVGDQDSEPFDPDKRLNQLSRYLWRELMRWPMSYRPGLATALRGFAEDISRGWYATS